MLLDATTKTIEALIEGAATTTNPVFSTVVATFAQPTPSGFVPSENDGALNGTTPVTVVAAPASGSVAQIKELHFFNADTVQHTVTVQLNNNSPVRKLIAVAVPSLQTLRYSDVAGWSLGAAPAIVPVGASSTSNIAAPTAPNSTASFTMQGLAGSITPKKSGTVLVTISGTVAQQGATTAGIGAQLQISHGTGAAPANNAALTGTQDGNSQSVSVGTTATAVGNVHNAFSLTALITGLTLGTAYWLDLAAKALVTVSDAPLQNVCITAIEL